MAAGLLFMGITLCICTVVVFMVMRKDLKDQERSKKNVRRKK